jgi:hypothetical protein
MPSAYLQATDYVAYGLPSSTTAAQVTQASELIDGYLRRPEGLIYTPDATGQPCYMTALSPELSFTSVGAFGPGNGIAVNVNGPTAMLQVGDCVVLDRLANPNLVEAVQITNISGQQVTLGTTAANVPNGVMFQHAAGCTMETGLLITEKRYLPKNRSEISLAKTPVARIVGGTGRYGYGRRGDQASYNTDNFNLLASLMKFGGPPAWEIWPANTAAGIEAETGQVWVPAGIMLAYYSEIKARYVAGFQYSNLPATIKLACAQLVSGLASLPPLGNVRTYQAGDTKIEQFTASLFSDDVKAMLGPYRARMFV